MFISTYYMYHSVSNCKTPVMKAWIERVVLKHALRLLCKCMSHLQSSINHFAARWVIYCTVSYCTVHGHGHQSYDHERSMKYIIGLPVNVDNVFRTHSIHYNLHVNTTHDQQSAGSLISWSTRRKYSVSCPTSQFNLVQPSGDRLTATNVSMRLIQRTFSNDKNP